MLPEGRDGEIDEKIPNKPPCPGRGVAPRIMKIGKLDSEPIFVLGESEPFDLIFMDPPYGQGWANVIVSALLSLPLLKENGILVLEHDLKEPIPEEVGNWGIGDQRRYGQTRVSFYKFKKG